MTSTIYPWKFTLAESNGKILFRMMKVLNALICKIQINGTRLS